MFEENFLESVSRGENVIMDIASSSAGCAKSNKLRFAQPFNVGPSGFKLIFCFCFLLPFLMKISRPADMACEGKYADLCEAPFYRYKLIQTKKAVGKLIVVRLFAPPIEKFSFATLPKFVCRNSSCQYHGLDPHCLIRLFNSSFIAFFLNTLN